MRAVLCLFFAWVLAVPAWADEAAVGIETTYKEHTRGVELARAGRYDEGLGALLPLLARFPDDYPLQRDVILITMWKGDCADALKRFEKVRHRPDLESYLVVPVSDCLLAANRPREARRLTRLALKRQPADESLRNALLKADLALRVDRNIDEESPVMDAGLYNDSSDQGLMEWIGIAEGSMRLFEDMRLYARYRFTRSSESAYRDGDLDRVGVGVRYRFDERWLLDQEFSTDVAESGMGGATTRVQYEPRDDWRFTALYASFAEAIPLRARAAGIDASQWSGEVNYESRDYRWEWAASLNRYDFSDSNQRTAFTALAGYAWERRARREQRLFLEWYQSNNTFDSAVYFNPSRDYSLGLTHRTDFVYDTRFKRSVGHLWFSIAAYNQQGFGSYPRWAVRYEQNYDFNEANALVAGTALARNVYDGEYESEWRFYLHYHRRF